MKLGSLPFLNEIQTSDLLFGKPTFYVQMFSMTNVSYDLSLKIIGLKSKIGGS